MGCKKFVCMFGDASVFKRFKTDNGKLGGAPEFLRDAAGDAEFVECHGVKSLLMILFGSFA